MLDTFVDALLKKDFATAEEVLNRGRSVDRGYGPNCWTALHYMAESNVVDAARWLLAHGANPNAMDSYGQTPLHLAIDSEADRARQRFVETGDLALSAQMTELLLENGADPNATTRRGKTALMVAKSTGHALAVDILNKYARHE